MLIRTFTTDRSHLTDDISQNTMDLGDDPRIKQILSEVCRITGMGFSAVAYVSEDRWIACQVEDRIEFGLDPGGELEIGKTICDEIRHSGQAIMVNDTGTDPDWWNHPVPILYGFHSYVSLPITLDNGRFFGTLCAIDPAPRTESIETHFDELQALAIEVATILSARIENGPGAISLSNLPVEPS